MNRASLESQIDALYQGPLDAFTASRNALAKSLSGADAKRVKTLSKPTVVPWAINQLFWHARPAWERLMKSGGKLRTSQLAALNGGAADIRAASDAHRAVVSDAAKTAQQLTAASGSPPPLDALMRALEALSVMPKLPAAPGRWTEVPQLAGFEALAGLKVREVGRVRKGGKVPDVREVGRVRKGGKVPEVREVGTVPKLRKVPRVREVRERQAAQARRREAAAAKKEAAAAKKRAAAAKRHAAEVHKAETAVARAKAALAAAEEKLSLTREP